MKNSVFLNFTNIYGHNIGKLITKERLDDINNSPVSFACLRTDGLGAEPNETDLYVLPDMDYSAKISLDKEIIEWIPCFLMKENAKHHFCPRTILCNAVNALADIGIEIYIGFEPEFYLLRKDYTPYVDNDSIIPAFNINGTLTALSFLEELENNIEFSGIKVASIVHEGGKSQFEFGLMYSEPVKAVDQLVRFKIIAKRLAEKYGLIASFMPKPFSDDFGSATQINYSIKNSSNEINNLSSIAGILKHAKSISAFTCPTTNSYKRLFSKSKDIDVLWSPSIVGFGYDNRSALVRVVSRDQRIEYRASDFSGNMYLSVASLLYAIYDGIKNNLSCPKPIDDNCFKIEINSKEMECLPISLKDALIELENDLFIVERMGKDFCADYIMNKKKEWFDNYIDISNNERGKYVDA